MQERIGWIDIAKGVGMLLVIAGHTISLHYSYPLYAFHMPLFFFLSGLVLIDKKESFFVFAFNKAKSILRPWFIILLISSLVCLSVPQWRDAITFSRLLSDLYTANTNVIQNSSLWYLVCFYFVLLLFYPLHRIKINKNVKIFLFFIFAVALLYIKEALGFTSLPLHRLPFKIDSALVALVFFIAGFYSKRMFTFTPPPPTLTRGNIVLFFIFLLILTVVLSVFNGWSNINSLDFGVIKFLYYPIAFLGIGTVCLMSSLLSLTPSKIKRFWIFYGQNSLLIFGFQSLFIRLYLLFFNNIQGLTMQLYGDNPVIHQIGSFVVVTFITSPAIVFIFKAYKKFILSYE